MKGSHAVYILYHFTKFYATIYMMTFMIYTHALFYVIVACNLIPLLLSTTLNNEKNMKFLIFKLKPKTLNFQINIIKTLKIYPI